MMKSYLCDTICMEQQSVKGLLTAGYVTNEVTTKGA